MARHELIDEQWELIEALPPTHEGKPARPFKDHRTVLNGLFWILNGLF